MATLQGLGAPCRVQLIKNQSSHP